MPGRIIYTLSSILKGIREYLDARIKGKHFWLRVEIANISFHSSGHCYLELTENQNGQNIAQCKGSIWRSNLTDIRRDLGADFDNVLKKGNEILCYVELQFTERYGFNIIIDSIDLSFNLGELEKNKQETINKLKAEGILDHNKRHALPAVIQHIAVVGSPDTAGFTDLIKTLNTNPYKFHFFITVFACSVQGDKAESEIIARLRELNNSRFDVIALIRGGGSKLDLEVFNSYNIAKEIALLSRPVFTGIGHETDISVADLAANLSHKTPSALGSFIVDRAYNFYVRFMTSFTSILEYKKHFMEDTKSSLKISINDLTSRAASYTRLRRGELHQSLNRLNSEANQRLNKEKNYLSLAHEIIRETPKNKILSSRSYLAHTVQLVQVNSSGAIKRALADFRFSLDVIFSYAKRACEEKSKYMSNISVLLPSYHPDNILNKGYAIPRFKNKLLRDQPLSPGDELEIELSKKSILVSFIKSVEKWKTLPTNRQQKK